MEYIDKSALIAEIEKELDTTKKYSTEYVNGKKYALNKILSFISTLEVKEVDLEKEFDTWRHNHFHGRRDKEACGEYLERVTQLELAEYFFELGLKAQKGGS